jgi:hypothetical protein
MKLPNSRNHRLSGCRLRESQRCRAAKGGLVPESTPGTLALKLKMLKKHGQKKWMGTGRIIVNNSASWIFCCNKAVGSIKYTQYRTINHYYLWTFNAQPDEATRKTF